MNNSLTTQISPVVKMTNLRQNDKNYAFNFSFKYANARL